MKLKVAGALLIGSLASIGAADHVVVEKGLHHRVLQSTKEIQTPLGPRIETNQIVELQGGLHRWTDQGWVETTPNIELFQDGAVARNLPYSAIFAPNLATPNAIDISLPDGQRLSGHLLGLALTENNRSVLIAEVKDCAGVVGGPEQNELTFPDALTDFDISVKFVLQRDRVSQILILHQQFPHPSEWGLTENAVLEILTEFTAFPDVRKEPREAIAGMNVEHVSLGSMEFVTGRGFSLGDDRSENSVPIFKSWDLFEGNRWFLVEKVPWKVIAPELAKLPPVAKEWRKKNDTLMARKDLRLPARREAKAASKPIRMADASGVASLPLRGTGANGVASLPLKGADANGVASLPAQRKGYVLDWELVSSVNSNLWRADKTYYIAGSVSIKTNIFEGGCVIKFAPTNSAKLTITGPVTCLSTSYAPIIMTARDDHTIGEQIGASALSGYYATKAMELDYYTSGTLYDIHDIRVSHATLGISFFQGRGHTARNVQLVRCVTGVETYWASFDLLNGLLANVSRIFDGSGSGNTTGSLQHVTFNQCSNLNSGSLTLYATNSLLVAVTNITSFTGAYNGTNSDPAAVFEVIGGGANYLTSGSAFRNAGTTNLNATLLAELRKKTTYAPAVLSNTISLNTTLRPYAQRDTDVPDLGYHYDPIDYALGWCVVTNATLTLTNGVAIATFGDPGIAVYNDAQIVSYGRPERRNQICRYITVQEQSTNWGNAYVGAHTQLYGYQWGATAPTGRFRFTDFSSYANGGYHIYLVDSGFVFSSLVIRDCEVNTGKIILAGSETSRIGVTNNLFHRAYTDFSYFAGLDAYNNLFKGADCLFIRYASSNAWTIKDNSFDHATIAQDGESLVHSNNAYINCATRLTPNAASDVVTNSFTYHIGPLGRYYQPTNSALVDMGSVTNSALAGMYHYSTATNALKEANSIINIGLHYVAADYATGVPLDYDGDTLGDWLEDIDGDGTYDSGTAETDWQSYNSIYGVGSGPGLQVFTPLKP